MAHAAGNNTVDVLEHCRVSPPSDLGITSKILPLTFFDIFWLNWPSLSRVYFYDFPCSVTEFNKKIVPNLKKSLASTLQHYYPLCGNLLIPTTLSTTTSPAIRYLDGDSVSLTVAELRSVVSEGFEYLSGNHAVNVDDLEVLVPGLPQGRVEACGDETVMVSPVISIQVTLLADQGISIGFRNSHVVADGKSVYNFIRMWADINAKQLIRDENDGILDAIPVYDRSVVSDPKGMASSFFRVSLRMAEEVSEVVRAVDKKETVQATFLMDRLQIQGLKESVSAQVPHVSTFIVVCAYVWTCLAKMRIALDQEMYGEFEVDEHFVFAMDARARLDPPIDSNYFGNAVLPCWSTLKTNQLIGQQGFLIAVKKIREGLDEKLNNEEGVLKGLDTVYDQIEATKDQPKFGVAGSPKFGYYSTDFGWGKPKKYKVTEKFSLAGSRDSEGGLELGFCFSRDEMEAFSTIFTEGLIM